MDDLSIEWVHTSDVGHYFDGCTFGDGSGIHTFINETRRCGWGVLSGAVDLQDLFCRRIQARGPLPGPLQVVPLAEMFAFMVFLRHALPVEGEYHFVTDCSYVADRFGKGKRIMCSGWTAHCQHWREIFRLADEIGVDLIRVRLVKAHRQVASAVGKFDEFLIRGAPYKIRVNQYKSGKMNVNQIKSESASFDFLN